MTNQNESVNKPHHFQIGINSEVDGIEAAAETAARAVNRYLAEVHPDVAVETSVVVSIGSDASENKGSGFAGFVDTNAIGELIEPDPYGDFDDDEDFEEVD